MKILMAYFESTPVLDGYIQENEYNDAFSFSRVDDWFSDSSVASQKSTDLSVKAWVKHDGANLYFAFDVTDDVLYGFDIERWTSDTNPKANKLNYQNSWS